MSEHTLPANTHDLTQVTSPFNLHISSHIRSDPQILLSQQKERSWGKPGKEEQEFKKTRKIKVLLFHSLPQHRKSRDDILWERPRK